MRTHVRWSSILLGVVGAVVGWACAVDRATAQAPERPAAEGAAGQPGTTVRHGERTGGQQPTPRLEGVVRVPRPNAPLMSAPPLPPHPLQLQYPDHDVVVCLAGCITPPPTIAHIAPRPPGAPALSLTALPSEPFAVILPRAQPTVVRAAAITTGSVASGTSHGTGIICVAGCGNAQRTATVTPPRRSTARAAATRRFASAGTTPRRAKVRLAGS